MTPIYYALYNLQCLVVVFSYLFIKEPIADIADKNKIYTQFRLIILCMIQPKYVENISTVCC